MSQGALMRLLEWFFEGNEAPARLFLGLMITLVAAWLLRALAG